MGARIRVVNDGMALESLRDSDFDTNSAIGEILDNSIQAEAKHIWIKSNQKPLKNSAKDWINEIYFIDDGIGMSADTLHKCLCLGWGERLGKRGKSIGRFGVGATLGGIHEARRIEIWSKRPNENKFRYVVLDLDSIAEQKESAGIDIPIEDIPPISLPAAANTVVKWSKIDKIKNAADTTLQKLNIWIGRTYRYFIRGTDSIPRVEISLNESPVKAIDPLYHFTEFTRFPDDEKSKLYSPIRRVVDIDRIDLKHTEGRTQSDVTILFSLLPESWRTKTGDGKSEFAKLRLIHENEGISILRNYREVYYGPLANLTDVKSDTKNADRFWGCEVHFSSDLDGRFSVRNIKNGAKPDDDLAEILRTAITPTLKTARDEYINYKNEFKSKTNRSSLGYSQLGIIESIGNTIAPTHPKISSRKNPEAVVEQLLQTQFANDSQIDELRNRFLTQKFAVQDTSLIGNDFFQVEHTGASIVVMLNMRHSFYALLSELATKESITIDDLRTVIGAVICAFSLAESGFEHTLKETESEAVFNDLRHLWGSNLRKILKEVEDAS